MITLVLLAILGILWAVVVGVLTVVLMVIDAVYYAITKRGENDE